MKIKKNLQILVGCLCICSCGTTSRNYFSEPKASISCECIQITSSNDCIVSVQDTGNSAQTATANALKSVVYEMLFNGIQGSSENRIQLQSPLVRDSSLRFTHKEFFDRFFSSGEYRDYSELLSGQVPEVIKTKNGYKVTVIVVVKKEALRKKLEKEGIINSLSNIL